MLVWSPVVWWLRGDIIAGPPHETGVSSFKPPNSNHRFRILPPRLPAIFGSNPHQKLRLRHVKAGEMVERRGLSIPINWGGSKCKQKDIRQLFGSSILRQTCRIFLRNPFSSRSLLVPPARYVAMTAVKQLRASMILLFPFPVVESW